MQTGISGLKGRRNESIEAAVATEERSRTRISSGFEQLQWVSGVRRGTGKSGKIQAMLALPVARFGAFFRSYRPQSPEPVACFVVRLLPSSRTVICPNIYLFLIFIRSILFQRHAALLVKNNAERLMSGFIDRRNIFFDHQLHGSVRLF